MDAVVTAGGRLTGALADDAGHTIKALVSIGGRTLLERVLGALLGAEQIERIAVVGPPEVCEAAVASGAHLPVPEVGTGIDNLLAGTRALNTEGQILMSTSDLVAIKPDDVHDFIERVPATAHVSYAATTKEEFLALFPGRADKHFVSLRDGAFVGGCLFVVDVETLRRLEPTLQLLFRARKLPVVLGSLVGAKLFAKIVLSRLLGTWIAPDTDEIKRRVEQALDCEAVIVRGASARLALDVDSRRDWEFATQYVAEAEHGTGEAG